MNVGYPELNFTLTRREAGGYRLDLSFMQPGSEGEVDPAAGQELTVQFDLEAYQALGEDSAAYGRALSANLFAAPAAREAFNRAQAAAAALGNPLRVRVQISAEASELQQLHWEKLYDSAGKEPLFNSGVLISRYLSSDSWKSVNLRPQHNLRALAAVSNPTDLDAYSLAPVDVTAELARAKLALLGIEVETMGGEAGPVTLDGLMQRLRQGKFDILYLVAHGMTRKGESALWLQNEQGETERVTGAALAEEYKKLEQQPVLTVLLACESARQEAGASLTAVGPLLAAAGAPAVLAMQGKISMESGAKFMPVFFQDLLTEGMVDHAVAVARNAVRGQPDAWMPTLFTRLKSGMIYGEATVEAKVTQQVGRLNRNLVWIAGAVVLLLLGLGGFSVWQSRQGVVLASTPTPSRMSQDFNVAVAEFSVVDGSGQPVDSPVGVELADFMAERLQSNFAKAAVDLTAEIWEAKFTGQISGATSDERRKVAEARALAINAHVLIYGQIVQTENGGEFSPEFYVNYKGFADNAPEVTGGNLFGRALAVEIPFDQIAALAGGNQALLARSKALSLITIGLAYYAFDNYPEAYKKFDEAVNLPDWLEGDGQELGYALRGSALVRDASLKKDFTRLPAALRDFDKAWSISGGSYGRALIGRGGVMYLEALRNPLDPKVENIDRDKLAEAEAIYNQALALPDQPEPYNVPSHAYFSLGQVYQVRGQILEEDGMTEQALEAYKKVTEAYECPGVQTGTPAPPDCGDKTLTEIASYAYARMGLMYALLGEYDESLAEYQNAFEISSPYFKAETTFSQGVVYLQQALEMNGAETPGQSAVDNAVEASMLLADAQAKLEDGVRRAESLAKQDLIDSYTPILAMTYSEQGKLARQQNDLENARSKLGQAKDLLSKGLARAQFKVDDPNTPEAEREQKQTYLDSWQPLLEEVRGLVEELGIRSS